MGVQNAFSGLIFILFETVPRLRRVDFDAPARGTQVLLLQDLSCSEVSCEPFQRCPTVPRCTPMRFRKVLVSPFLSRESLSSTSSVKRTLSSFP